MRVWFAIYFHQSLYLEISTLNIRSLSRLFRDSPLQLFIFPRRKNTENSHLTLENLNLRLTTSLARTIKALASDHQRKSASRSRLSARERKDCLTVLRTARPFTRRRPRVFPDSGNCVSLLACCTVHLPLTMRLGPCARCA